MANRVLRFTVFACCLLGSAIMDTDVVRGEKLGENPPIRDIYVPFEELNVLLEGSVRRVLMSRNEYAELLAKAKQTPDAVMPLRAALLSADSEIAIDGLRAQITTRLTCEVLVDGLHLLPLDLEGVGIQQAELDGKPASLGVSPTGKPALFVGGRGRHEVVLKMVTALETGASQQTLKFRLPRPAAARLRATVLGNVEVRGGADVVTREVDEAAGITRFELVPVDGSMSLALSLNNRRRQQQRVVVARSVVIDEITEAYERLHAVVSLTMLHQAVDKFRFAMPAGFEVSDVQSQQLARWSVAGEGDKRILEVTLRQESTDKVVLNISAVRSPARLESWTFPQLEPLDTAGQVAVVGVLLEDRLKAEDIVSESLLPIDNDVLARAIPASVFAAEPGAPRVRPIAAFYAADAAPKLSAKFVRPPPRLLVTANTLLTLTESGLEARGGLALAPEAETLHEFDFTAPAGWQVTSVAAAGGAPLPFERYGNADVAGRIHVRLANKIDVGTSQSVYFEARRTPSNWLGAWTTQSIEYPSFSVVGAAVDTGALAVDARDDMTARPDVLANLTPLDEAELRKYGLIDVPMQLAFRYDAPGYQAKLVVERTSARTTARTYSFFHIEADLLTAHYEVIYDVTRARTRRLELLLPKSTPAAVTLRALDGTTLKEYAAEETDAGRRWTALLADASQGRIRLAVDFQQPLATAAAESIPLPVVRADGVVFQSGVVAVEGSADIDVQITKHPRKVDVGELAEADYQTGRRLLGAFGFAGEDFATTVHVERPQEYGLQSALVQQARYVTVLGANGRAQTSAEMRIRTRAGFLEMRLPAGSTLWSAELDGKPAQPQREGDHLLLSFPATGGALRTLKVAYETGVTSFSAVGRVRIPAPSLFLRAKAAAPAAEVPVADVDWQLHLPTDYRVIRSSGSVTATDAADAPQLAATQIASFLYTATGGVRGPAMGTYERGREVTSALSSYDGKSPKPATGSGGGGAASFDLRQYQLHDSDLNPGAQPPGNSNRFFKSNDDLKIVLGGQTHASVPALPGMPPTTAVPFGTMGEAAAPTGAGTLNLSGSNTYTGGVTTAPSKGTSIAAKEKGVALEPEAAQGYFEFSGKSRSGSFDLGGVRSLKIDLQAGSTQGSGNVVTFRSLGADPVLDVTLVDQRRSGALASLLALTVLLYGVMLTNKSAARKIRFIVGVCLAATLIPLVTGWFELTQLVNSAFYAACWLIPYYLVAALLCRILRASRSNMAIFKRKFKFSASIFVLLGAAGACQAQGLGPLVVEVAPKLPPVAVPDNANILLYQSAKDSGVPKADQMLVPYERYQMLWNRAYPDKSPQAAPPPAPYAPAGAEFTASLQGTEYLVVSGRLDFDFFTDEFVEIPLPLAGGVLASATLDGKPARLNVVRSQTPPQSKAASSKVAMDSSGSLVVLVASGKGRHKLEIIVHLRLEKVGGWFTADARLPVAGAATLALTVPQADSEVRLGGIPDRRNYAVTKAGEVIVTALAPDGALRIQWREKIGASQIDQTLKVKSEAVLAVQEDGLRLAWKLALEFSAAQRETFTVTVPKDYLVERVMGDNVRGWEPREAGNERKLEITLLRAVGDQEQFTIYLSRRSQWVAATEFTLPIIGVEGAAVHNGQISVRRSLTLDLRTIDAAGLTRTDLLPAAESTAASADVADVSPLGMRSYQSYRFAAPSFALRLAVEPQRTKATAEVLSVLKIAERERRLESQLVVQSSGAPLYRLQTYLPEDFHLEQVLTQGAFEWAVTTIDGRQLLSIYFAAGRQGPFTVVLNGLLGAIGPLAVVPLPRMELLGVESQQGDIVVQVDPAFHVEATELRGCEPQLLDRTFRWLSAAQRSPARLALRCSSGDYAGNLKLTARAADVRCKTVTNVRVTDRAIEESILLDFTIRDAGIREVMFLLPASLRDAQISVPRLRQKTIEPVGTAGTQVRVRLQLQDEVMDQLRVLIENDRIRATGAQEAPIPTIETGATEMRFVALESMGSDEVVVDQVVGLDPLSRQQQQWQLVAGLVGRGTTQAFRTANSPVEPRLTFQARTRDKVETVGARIGLAEATLVFDETGAYRAVQLFRMDNRSEQFLVVELPAGASLWTAWTAGEPVKPVGDPAAASREVRIPLVKTAEGDRDYEIKLTYGGKLPHLESLQEVKFPLMRTVNVKVELSQVRLYLPETYHWIHFGGTMKPAAEEADLQAGNLSYFNKSAEKLVQTLQEGDEFAKLRANSSLQQLKTENETLLGSIVNSGSVVISGGSGNTAPLLNSGNSALQLEVTANANVWRNVEEQQRQQASQVTKQGAGTLTLNSGALSGEFSSQINTRSRNIVGNVGTNFDTAQLQTQAPPPFAGGKPQFGDQWLLSNGLANNSQQLTAGLTSRVQVQGASNLNLEGLHNSITGAANAGTFNTQPVAPNVTQGQASLQAQQQLGGFLGRSNLSTADNSLAAGDQRRNEQGEVLERYRRRLEEQVEQKLDQKVTPNQAPQRGARVDVGAANVFTQSGSSFAVAVPEQAPAAQPPGERAPTGMAADNFSSDLDVPTALAGMASLDIEIPRRGALYRFTTPLGDPTIKALPVSAPFMQSLQRLAAVLAALAVLRFLWRYVAAGRWSTFARSRSGAILISAAGLFSIVLGFFPVVGLGLLVGGIILFVINLARRSPIPSHGT